MLPRIRLARPQSRPDNTIRTTMISTRPRPPLGPYPQFLLWDQRGVDPINNTMRTINNNVPVLMRSPSMVEPGHRTPP